MANLIEKLRLNQLTTWIGMVTFVCTMFGVAIKPELQAEIATLGTTVSCIFIGFNEK